MGSQKNKGVRIERAVEFFSAQEMCYEDSDLAGYTLRSFVDEGPVRLAHAY